MSRNVISTLDIETLDGLKGSKFGIGGFFANLSYNRPFSFSEKNEKKFFENVFNFSKSSKKKILCYIQNEDFDIRFILKYCIDELNIYPYVIQSGSKILEVRIKEYNIIFRDIYQFLLCSQEKAEKILLGKKVKIDVDFVEIQKMLNSKNINTVKKAYKILEERVKSDVKGLFEVIEKFYSIIKKDFNVSLYKYLTLPSLSLAVYRKNLKKNFGINFLSLNPYISYFGRQTGLKWKSNERKELYYWTRKAYFGGRNEIFDLSYLKDIYYYDANSLYPTVCIKNKFPNPKSYIIYDYPTSEFFERKIKGKMQYIIEAKVKENIEIPVLAIRNDVILFVNGTKKGVWASPIFERFLKFKENNLIEIIKIKIFEQSDYYLQDFMKTRYINRLKYIRVKNDVQSFEEKQLMNSLTGKFAQKPLRENWVLYNPDLEEEMNMLDVELDIIEYDEKYKMIKVEKELLQDFLLVDWTIFITAFSQVELHEKMYDILEHEGKVFYCDTDCVFSNIPLEIINKNIVGDNFGQWKNELEAKLTTDEIKELRKKGIILKIDEAKFYLPKVYALKINGNFDIKCKGISLFMIYESLNIKLVKNETTTKQLYEILNSFEKIEKLLFLDGTSMQRFLKYKSSLRQNSSLVSWGNVSKKVSKVYDKRIILEDLSTIPLNNDNKTELINIQSQNLNTLLRNNISYYAT